MNEIPCNTAPAYESDVKELLQLAAKYFAGDFITGVHYIFMRPDLTYRDEVQIYAGHERGPVPSAELTKQFEAGRICMEARFMYSSDAPWREITFPAYKDALTQAAQHHISEFRRIAKSIARLTPEEQAEVNAKVDAFIEAVR